LTTNLRTLLAVIFPFSGSGTDVGDPAIEDLEELADLSPVKLGECNVRLSLKAYKIVLQVSNMECGDFLMELFLLIRATVAHRRDRSRSAAPDRGNG
jgi:hypothetical protein